MNKTRKEIILEMRARRCTYTEIGEEFGVTRQRIGQILAPTTRQPRFMDKKTLQRGTKRCLECKEPILMIRSRLAMMKYCSNKCRYKHVKN
jgi:hypothetical protein